MEVGVDVIRGDNVDVDSDDVDVVEDTVVNDSANEVEVEVLRGMLDAADVPVPASISAGESNAKPTEGGSNLNTVYTFFCEHLAERWWPESET